MAPRPLALERADAVATGNGPNRENVIAQLIPCIRQVRKGQIGAKTPIAPRPLALERAGAVATGKCPNRENVIAQLVLCIRQVVKGQIGATTQICLLPGSNPILYFIQPKRQGAPPFGAGESGRGRSRKMSKS